MVDRYCKSVCLSFWSMLIIDHLLCRFSQSLNFVDWILVVKFFSFDLSIFYKLVVGSWGLVRLDLMFLTECFISSVQFSSVGLSCPTLCNPMNCSTPSLPVHHQLPEFTQTHVHRVSDAIQPSHPLSYPSSPAPNPFQHQSLFQWVNSSHEVAKVLEFQL